MKDTRLIGHSGNNRFGIRTFSSVLQYRTDKGAVVEISVLQEGEYYRAEVIEPFSPMFGYRATALSVEEAKKRLSDKLCRVFGFIGTFKQGVIG